LIQILLLKKLNKCRGGLNLPYIGDNFI